MSELIDLEAGVRLSICIYIFLDVVRKNIEYSLVNLK